MLTKKVTKIKVRCTYSEKTEKHYFPSSVYKFCMSSSYYFVIHIQTFDLEWILQSNSIHYNRYSTSKTQEVSSAYVLQAHCWLCIYGGYQNTLAPEHLRIIDSKRFIHCNSPFQRQFIENSEKLNNLPRSYRESWGGFVSWVLFLCHNSPPWQPEPAVTGIGTDPHLDLWNWVTVKSKPTGTQLSLVLPRFWLTWNKYLMKEMEQSL